MERRRDDHIVEHRSQRSDRIGDDGRIAEWEHDLPGEAPEPIRAWTTPTVVIDAPRVCPQTVS
jgi:hypothetical protein